MKRSEFLADLFYFAREKNVSIAMARPLLSDVTQGDIDLLIRKSDIGLIKSFVDQAKSLKITSRFHRTDGETVYIHGVENGTAHAIHIDLITALNYQGISYLDINHVLERAEPDEKNIHTLHDIDQALILLMTHAIKHKGAIKQSSIDSIRIVLKNNPTAFQQALMNLFGAQATLDLLEILKDNTITEKFWKRMADAYTSHAWQWRGASSIIDRMVYKIKRAYMLLTARRINVAVYGIDGAGKTTLINYLEKTLAETVTTIRLPHFLPSWPWRSEADSRGILPDPHAKKMRDPFTSSVKLVYLLFRYWIAYLWPRAGTTLFIFDRSLPDIIVDPKRYRYAGSATLLRWVCRLAPSVKASLLVDTGYEVALKRKAEIPASEAKRQSEAYRQLIAYMPNPIVIKGEMAVDRMTAIATAHIIQAMKNVTETP